MNNHYCFITEKHLRICCNYQGEHVVARTTLQSLPCVSAYVKLYITLLTNKHTPVYICNFTGRFCLFPVRYVCYYRNYNAPETFQRRRGVVIYKFGRWQSHSMTWQVSFLFVTPDLSIIIPAYYSVNQQDKYQE